MHSPDFFTSHTIELYDPLSELLGAFEHGMYSISYLDVVKLAGHSCPTVAGAFLMAQSALKALYKDATPQRGMICVEFRESKEEGVTGVVANLLSMITGAADEGGFKGINQKHARHSLVSFSNDIKETLRVTRLDTKQSVALEYNPASIPPEPTMQPLMQKVLTQQADANEKREFARLWQERVAKILQNPDKVVFVREIR